MNNKAIWFKDLRENLTASIFSNSKNDEKEYFKNIYVPNYLKKVEKVFSVEEIELIFYSLKIAGEELAPANPGGDKFCDCNKGSLFGCGTSQNCRSSKCTAETDGCGFLWAWECNGLCRLFS